MQRLTWLFKLLLQAACFFVLFAFALNNQHDVTVHFFFGTYWRGPLVLLVLAVFAAGVLLGAIGLLPRWWRRRQAQAVPEASPHRAADRSAATQPSDPVSAAHAVAASAAARPAGLHGS